ncbi:pirin family protein [Oecophyllibacter saccharovorans]|uniref:Pirin family protein n=1 Tax=Oecophyllibacter saccharovorans TaxID=2558360 RepID=A0A506UL69_9PROT|nr:pirin family protein [Oecophyllibacter saccharovorans]TPW34107.1 pirin family protein [Oecophyllibacter saccharovorans]
MAGNEQAEQLKKAPKKVQGVYPPSPPHWVGDGFPVQSLFTYRDLGKVLNPFILLDHAGPAAFPPAPERMETPRGVGTHPHRGFETVTIVFGGQVAHGDSAGNSGSIGPGDVQWMTAGRGVLHQEFHAPEFTRDGGVFDVAQLWINLPARDKMTAPAYQPLAAADMQAVALTDPESVSAETVGSLRVIAGHFSAKGAEGEGGEITVTGPARSFTPLNVWDVTLAEGKSSVLACPEGWVTALAVIGGALVVEGVRGETNHTVVLSRQGTRFRIEAPEGAHFLVLTAQPLEEPIAGEGPFVMNERQELHQAFEDLRRGHFGTL